MSNYDRPTRGTTRLNQLRFDPAPLVADLESIQATASWQTLPQGENWGKIELIKNDYRHPALERCPAILQVLTKFDAPVLALTLAQLGPGGSVKEHRDISGGVPMGAIRFHIPIVTHPEVQFYVNGKRLYLAPGEVWNLDTTYRHRLANLSDVWRVHMILDLEVNEKLRRMLPRRDLRDACHSVYFWMICCAKGLRSLRHPKQLADRLSQIYRLRVLRKSTLS